ncbi:MAG: UDP-N-acetylglucosamine 1-carboxyvinyltransferase [Firmicutes bacterium]|nr:UDP-N-acetylglucosamine 1-carboxyvinyltransferase [Bacillota bacterium]
MEKFQGEKFVINGGRRLEGLVRIGGAKNSVLPILAASILSDSPVSILDVPNILDVENLLVIMAEIGCKVIWDKKARVVRVDSSGLKTYNLTGELVAKLRSSVFLMGGLLARFGRVNAGFPGGCAIGERPIDLHLKGFKALGAYISASVCDKTGSDIIAVESDSYLSGSEISLTFPSVGATVNIMLAASLAKGKTTILGAAKEPEIEDLAGFINTLGGKVYGAGTNKIIIQGVKRLGCPKKTYEYTPISDRIVFGTYILATIMTGGDVSFKNGNLSHLKKFISTLKNTCQITTKNGIINFKADRAKLDLASGIQANEQSTNITTGPHPSFPTDLQSQFVSYLTTLNTKAQVSETMFENRFKQVPDLIKMGACLSVEGNTLYINGGSSVESGLSGTSGLSGASGDTKILMGAKVTARDLRGGASLVLAGLVANGATQVYNAKYIDRGYEQLEVVLSNLGADIKRV